MKQAYMKSKLFGKDQKQCCPTFPVPIRDRVYARYGYTYAGGRLKQPIAFWVLVQRMLDELEDRNKRSIS